MDIVAEDHEVGVQEGVVLGGSGVGEFEAVRTVVHADVVDEGLVEVAEEGQIGGFDAGGVAAMAEAAEGCC